jgi:periplasmic nitrate reductase NapD
MDLSNDGGAAGSSIAVIAPLLRENIVARSQNLIGRRALITGRLLNPNRVIAPPGGEIASILVQARPERLGDVEAAILALQGCEIYGRAPKGKLVVVVDAPDAGSLGTTLNQLALLPDVYSASLVFHAIDATT